MYFLVQIKIKTDGTIEKGTSNYETLKEAIIQFHIAMSSAMTKPETSKFTVVIIDENGKLHKRETYDSPAIEENTEVI